MLRALIFIHCDGCHRMYEKLYTTMNHDPNDWPEEVKTLAGPAEKAGWFVPPNWSNLLCTRCSEEYSKAEF
jgi:hypothetical protein